MVKLSVDGCKVSETYIAMLNYSVILSVDCCYFFENTHFISLFILFQTLVRSALIGVGVGLSVAFPILVIATHNIVTGLYATFVIIIITVSVMGLIPLAGWKLGVS